MNIFDLADENRDHLSSCYSQIEAECNEQEDIDRLQRFKREIKNTGSVTINLRQLPLNEFLIGGLYKNKYEVKEKNHKELEDADIATPELEEALKKALKLFYKNRTMFDRHFEDGDKFDSSIGPVHTQAKSVTESNINPHDKLGVAMAQKMGISIPFKKVSSIKKHIYFC